MARKAFAVIHWYVRPETQVTARKPTIFLLSGVLQMRSKTKLLLLVMVSAVPSLSLSSRAVASEVAGKSCSADASQHWCFFRPFWICFGGLEPVMSFCDPADTECVLGM